jgi:hypothetical protein
MDAKITMYQGKSEDFFQGSSVPEYSHAGCSHTNSHLGKEQLLGFRHAQFATGASHSIFPHAVFGSQRVSQEGQASDSH